MNNYYNNKNNYQKSYAWQYSKHKSNFCDDDSEAEITEGLRVRAKRRAMYLLANRDYCYNELLGKLRENYPETLAVEVADTLVEYGYVDDFQYAERLAKRLIVNKKYGKRRAEMEMRNKGLGREAIENALDLYQKEDIREEIFGLIERKYADRLDDANDARKVFAALARRGYSYDDIKYCIKNYTNSIDEDEYYDE